MRGKVVAAKGATYSSRKEQVTQSYQKLLKAQEETKAFEKLQPELRKSLLQHMVTRTPIEVLQPMAYWTEELNKGGDDEIDRAYYNRGSSENADVSFQITKRPILPGTTLTFSHIDSQLGQWIFKSSTGPDIEIYDTPTIQIPGHGGQPMVVQNDGFWGLLTSTNIYRDLLESLSEAEEQQE